MNYNENSDGRDWTLLFLCWVIASVATLGSLFFSEIAGYPPCSLCWYQRIFMYPLSIILLCGLFPFDKSVVKLTLPLVILGFITSIYHNLLQLDIIPETMTPCLEGVPCSGNYISWLGFITIPVMALVAFALILCFLITIYRRNK